MVSVHLALVDDRSNEVSSAAGADHRRSCGWCSSPRDWR